MAKEDSFDEEIEFELKEGKTFGTKFFMMVKIRNFGRYLRNTWEVLKCGAGEGWRSVGPIV